MQRIREPLEDQIEQMHENEVQANGRHLPEEGNVHDIYLHTGISITAATTPTIVQQLTIVPSQRQNRRQSAQLQSQLQQWLCPS